jgi:predicted ribosome quality control (RQC) complex YloA/Tae2 family protein
VVQPDAYTLSLRLRTPLQQGWLHLSWHPTAARLAVGAPPARGAASEAFSFADAATQQLKGLVLVAARVPQPWERVARLEFGVRPGDAPSRLAYCEVMAKYSNVILTDGGGSVVAAAYQVGGRMSSLRQVQQGRAYALPPVTSGVAPGAGEGLAAWRDNVARAAELAAAGPAPSLRAADAADGDGVSTSSSGGRGTRRQAAAAAAAGPTVLGGCVRAYQGVSPALIEELCAAAGVPPAARPDALSDAQWKALHGAWLAWLERVESGNFAASVDEAATSRSTKCSRLTILPCRPPSCTRRCTSG